MNHPTIFDESPIQLPPMGAAHFSADRFRIIDPKRVLAELGIETSVRVHIDMGGVDGAPSGAIQDPAGSAVGAATRPADAGAGGASGAIYERFPDLEPIPALVPGAAVFNSTSGSGRRVVHTHSPHLGGLDPSTPADRREVLNRLANGYFNTIDAFIARADALGDDGHLLNLVPISAAIYAGRFRDSALNHLHPGYTLVAIHVALGELMTRTRHVPNLTIYYHSATVHAVAETVTTLL